MRSSDAQWMTSAQRVAAAHAALRVKLAEMIDMRHGIAVALVFRREAEDTLDRAITKAEDISVRATALIES